MNMGVAVTLGVLYFLWMSRRFVLAGRRRRRSLDSRERAREIHDAAIVAAIRKTRGRGI